MAFTYWIQDTLTGVKKVRVDPSSGTWGNVLNGIGSGSHTFQVTDEVAAKLPWDTLTKDWANMLVIYWQTAFMKKVIYAGLMQAVETVFDTGVMTVEHVTFRAIFKRRTTLGENGYGGVDGGRDEIVNKTLASIAVRIAQDACLGPTPGYGLKVVFPALVDGAHSRTYRDWNFPVADDEIANIQNTENGPDIDFLAREDGSGNLEHVMRSGALTGATLEWNLTVHAPALIGVSVKSDGRLRTTNAYTTGSGSEILMPVKWARMTPTAGPALDSMREFSDEISEPVLQGHANAELATFSGATTQWTASMIASGTPGIGDLVLGQTIRVYTPKIGHVSKGWKTLRLIGFSGDMSETVTLKFQGGA